MAIFDIVGRINQEQDTTILLVERRAHMALENADYGHVKAQCARNGNCQLARQRGC